MLTISRLRCRPILYLSRQPPIRHAPLLCSLHFISVHPRSCIHVSQTSFCNMYMKPIKFKIVITLTLLLLFIYMFVYILMSVPFVPLDNKVNNDTERQGNSERDVDDSIRYRVYKSCVYLYAWPAYSHNLYIWPYVFQIIFLNQKQPFRNWSARTEGDVASYLGTSLVNAWFHFLLLVIKLVSDSYAGIFPTYWHNL